MSKIVPFPKKSPEELSEAEAISIIRDMAEDSAKVAVLNHCNERMKKRGITRRQIDTCLKKGTIVEGPFLNKYGNWQVNLQRHAAGEQIVCVVAIDWGKGLLVITAFYGD